MPQTTRCRAIALGSKEELRGQHSQYWLVCRQPGLGRTSRRSLPAETARSGRRQFKQDYKRTDSTTPANDWPVSSIVMASRALATRSPTSGGKSTTPSRAVSMSISNSSGVKAVASARTSISWRRSRLLGREVLFQRFQSPLKPRVDQYLRSITFSSRRRWILFLTFLAPLPSSRVGVPSRLSQ